MKEFLYKDVLKEGIFTEEDLDFSIVLPLAEKLERYDARIGNFVPTNEYSIEELFIVDSCKRPIGITTEGLKILLEEIDEAIEEYKEEYEESFKCYKECLEEKEKIERYLKRD